MKTLNIRCSKCDRVIENSLPDWYRITAPEYIECQYCNNLICIDKDTKLEEVK